MKRVPTFKILSSIALTTVGAAIRRRALLIILFIGLLFLMIAPGLSVLSARQERSVLIGLTLGIIQLTSAVIAIVLTISLIPEEIERRTLYMILSKPVQRWHFFIAKYLGAILALGLMMLLMTSVLVVMFAIQQGVYDLHQLALLLKAPLMYYLQMSLLAALAMFFSTFMTPMVNFFLSGGIYLVGSLFNPLIETLSNSSQTPGPMKAIATLVGTILPNFANYNVQNPIINPGQQIQNESLYFFNVILYGIFYICILLISGMLIFDRREV
jgi:ABC-type transport system involved in multi-copper enzyme maturation permease subunit